MASLFRTVVLGLSMSLSVPVVAVADDIASLVRDYDAYNRQLDPVRAAQRGDVAASRIWPDNSPAAVARRTESLKGFRGRLQSLSGFKPGSDDALNRDLMVDRVAIALEAAAFDEERMPFISGDGFYTTPDYAALNTVLKNEADAAAWIARLEALPAYFGRETENMRRGISTGFMQPRSTVERAIADIKGQLDLPVEKAPVLAPFAALSSTMSAESRAALTARGRVVFEDQVRPAQRALLDFFENEYLPHARKEIGIASVPQGRAYYEHLVRRHTTTNMTPEQIHTLGLSEVARIRARMDQVIASTGFQGTFAEFLKYVRSEPRFYVNAATYGEKASEVAKRADFALPRFFGKLPRLTYGVRAIPAGLENSANGYLAGSPERGVAGMVVYKPWMAEKMPTFGQAAWVLHEGVPGHHLQIALSQELTSLPEFRRDADVNAFSEGWGLYSEKLGEDMGIYRDPYEQFGRLSLEIWRACRLVIDTGMHVMGWPKERAMACLQDNSALAPAEIEFEVERYIAWPGQALAYKIGEQKIIELRTRAERALGPRFDIRSFHDELLGAGAMPLGMLEARMDRWVEAQRAATTPP